MTSIDPGNAPDEVFWTIPISPDRVQVDLDNAAASYEINGLQTLDFRDTDNDLKHGPSVPATASFRVEWSGINKRVKIRDRVNGFAGQFIEATATIEWSAKEDGLSFVSEPAETSHTEFAMIGHERNGVFFPQGKAD